MYVFPILELEKPQDDQRWSSLSTLKIPSCAGMNKVVSAHFVKDCRWNSLLATYLATCLRASVSQAVAHMVLSLDMLTGQSRTKLYNIIHYPQLAA